MGWDEFDDEGHDFDFTGFADNDVLTGNGGKAREPTAFCWEPEVSWEPRCRRASSHCLAAPYSGRKGEAGAGTVASGRWAAAAADNEAAAWVLDARPGRPPMTGWALMVAAGMPALRGAGLPGKPCRADWRQREIPSCTAASIEVRHR